MNMNRRIYLTNKVTWQKGNNAQLKRPKKNLIKCTLTHIAMNVNESCPKLDDWLLYVCVFAFFSLCRSCIVSLIILWLSLALIIFSGIRWFVFFAHIILMTFGRFVWRRQTFSMAKPQPNGPSIWISACILHNAFEHFIMLDSPYVHSGCMCDTRNDDPEKKWKKAIHRTNERWNYGMFAALCVVRVRRVCLNYLHLVVRFLTNSQLNSIYSNPFVSTRAMCLSYAHRNDVLKWHLSVFRKSE